MTTMIDCQDRYRGVVNQDVTGVHMYCVRAVDCPDGFGDNIDWDGDTDRGW